MSKISFQPTLRSQISHELITPLSGLMVLLEHLKATDLTPEQAAYMVDIQSSADQLLSAQDKVSALLSESNHIT
jgi:signal transduction histidine kinase